MGSNPVNLALRFFLEVAALVAIGLWGWRQQEGWLRFVMAFALPAITAVVWVTFNVPNDPSRSGAAPVVVPGILRLAIELAIFAAGTLALNNSGYSNLSWLMAIALAVHYIISYDRIQWLLRH